MVENFCERKLPLLFERRRYIYISRSICFYKKKRFWPRANPIEITLENVYALDQGHVNQIIVTCKSDPIEINDTHDYINSG